MYFLLRDKTTVLVVNSRMVALVLEKGVVEIEQVFPLTSLISGLVTLSMAKHKGCTLSKVGGAIGAWKNVVL